MNLLSISSDFVTADELAQLALEAADGGAGLDGVVVVNPDPSDNTSGLIATTRSVSCPPRHRRTGQSTSWCGLETLTAAIWLAGTPFEPGPLMDSTMYRTKTSA